MTAQVPIGRTGKAFNEVIDEINDFIVENLGEIIMLQVMYLLGIRNVPSIGPIYWDEEIKEDFFGRLKQINNRCPDLLNGKIKSMEQLNMGNLQKLNDGKGCVLVSYLKEKIKSEGDHTSHKDGIYDATDIDWTNSWPNKEDTQEVAEYSVSAWEKKEDFHVTQWLSTPHFLTSIFSYGLQGIAVLPTNPALY